jgi:hypothetical protein
MRGIVRLFRASLARVCATSADKSIRHCRAVAVSEDPSEMLGHLRLNRRLHHAQ